MLVFMLGEFRFVYVSQYKANHHHRRCKKRLVIAENRIRSIFKVSFVEISQEEKVKVFEAIRRWWKRRDSFFGSCTKLLKQLFRLHDYWLIYRALIGNRQFFKCWAMFFCVEKCPLESVVCRQKEEKKETPLNLIYVNCFIIISVSRLQSERDEKKMWHEKRRTLQRRRKKGKCINPSTGHNCFITVSTHIPLTT